MFPPRINLEPEWKLRKKIIASLEKLIAIVELYHKEVGDCDHSVGICLCGEKRDLAEAKELLASL